MQHAITSAVAGLALVGAIAMVAIPDLAQTAARDPQVPNDVLTPGIIASTDVAGVCGYVGGQSYEARHRLYESDRNAYYALRRAVFRAYGVPWEATGDYQLDDRAPLSLGGEQTSLNLWPEPMSGPCGAHDKDKLERAVWFAVCREHSISLVDAQAMFIAPADWRVAYRQTFGHSCAQ